MEIPCAIVARNDNGDPTVYLRGEVDFRNASVLLDGVRLAARLPGEVIMVSLEAVTFMDSSGISALVRAALGLERDDRYLRLVKARPHLIRVLRTAGFTRYFLFEPEEDWCARPHLGNGTRSHVWRSVSFSVPSRLTLLAHVRGRVTDLIEGLPGCEEHEDLIRLAVGEAAANAVRHGCRGNETLKIDVRGSTDGELLLVEITDPGSGFDPSLIPTPEDGELREGGMGIHFMRLSMDEVTYRFDEHGTTVRLKKSLRPSGMADGLTGLPASPGAPLPPA